MLNIDWSKVPKGYDWAAQRRINVGTRMCIGNGLLY